MASVGLEMGIAVALGWAVGSWLDSKLHTTPWLMLLFLLFGVVAGFKGLYAAAREAMHDGKKSKD
ncbi:MAG: AtpZ/AtpI family protein [Deltaproteobacteria bacterium]|nr:AtpZ/AtpI family protein [Deltaproteobacteria bacterium]